MNISEHLKHLLVQNGRAILPGFGEFTTTSPADQAQTSDSLTPPFQTVDFNPATKANDYVLARFVAEQEGVSISEGNQLIQEYVNHLLEELERQQHITLPGIGTCRMDDPSGNIRFEPDAETNFDASAFGLEPVKVDITPQSEPEKATPEPVPVQTEETAKDTKPISAEAEEEETPVVDQEPVDEEPGYSPDAETTSEDQPPPVAEEGKAAPPRRKRKGIYIVLILLAALFTTLAVWVYLQPDKANELLNNWSQKVKELTGPKDRLPEEPPAPPTDDIAPEKTDKALVSEDTTSVDADTTDQHKEWKADPYKKEPTTTVVTGDYVIIAGAFSRKENAEQMVARLISEGFPNATIDGQTGTGLWRVAAGTYQTEAEASQTIRNAQSDNKLSNAWVSKRKTN